MRLTNSVVARHALCKGKMAMYDAPRLIPNPCERQNKTPAALGDGGFKFKSILAHVKDA